MSRDFVAQVCSGEVGHSYVKYLQILNHKLERLNDPRFRATPAAKEVKVPLDRLRLKASDNIRNWLLQRINDLRDHYGTDQIAIQTILRRSQYLLAFLKMNSPDVERSLREYYIAIMSRIYLENFKLLAKRVIRLMSPASASNETILPISVVRGLFSTKIVVSQTQFWALGERFRLLHEMLSPPQPFGDDQYPVESLVRGLYQILIDALTAEHNFASEFFNEDTISLHIFQQTASYLEHFMLELLKHVNDPIAILFFLRFNLAHQQEMRRRNILKLEQHLTSVRLLLMERFKALAAANVSAVRECDPAVFIVNAKGAAAVGDRFKDFAVSASLLLCDELTELVNPELLSVSEAVNFLLMRIASGLSVPVFLVNCYSVIVHGLGLVKNSVLFRFYEERLNDATNQFIDHQLATQFVGLLKTITGAFQVLESSDPPTSTSGIAEPDLRDIAVDFRDKHRPKIKTITDALRGAFESVETEREVITKLAKRLTLYWAKFMQLCGVVFAGKPPPAWHSSLLTPGQLVGNIQSLTS